MKLFSGKHENGNWTLTEKILIIMGAVCLIAGGTVGVRAAVDGFEAADEEVTVLEVKDGICYMSDGSMQTESGENVVTRNCSLDGKDYYYIEKEDGTLTTLDGAGVLVEEEGTEYILYSDGSKTNPDGSQIEDDTVTEEADSGDTLPEEDESEEITEETSDEEDTPDEGTADDPALIPEDVFEEEPESLEYDDTAITFTVTSAASWDENEYPSELTVPVGTQASELDLPDCFIMSGTYTREYMSGDSVVYTETADADNVYITIGWECPDYASDEAGEYTFTYACDESALGYSIDDSNGILEEMGVRYVTVVPDAEAETIAEDEITALGAAAADSEEISIYIRPSGDGVMIGSAGNYIKAGSKFTLTADITGTSTNLKYKWTVNNSKVNLSGDTSQTVNVTDSTSAGSEVTVSLTVTDAAGNKYNEEYVYLSVASALSIDASESTSGNLLIVNVGATVELHAVYSSGIDEGSITWKSNINELNGKTGPTADFTVSSADATKYIQVSAYDNSSKSTVTSDKLTVSLNSTTAPTITVTDSDNKTISSVNFSVTEGYTKSVKQTITLTPVNATSQFKMQTDKLPESASCIDYTQLGSTGTGSAPMVVTLKGGSGLTIGSYNDEESIKVKYGLTSSIEYAGTVKEIPININVVRPLQITAPAAYKAAAKYRVDSGTDISITPVFVETTLTDPQITYQWYQIDDYDSAHTYTIDDLSGWTKVSGAASRTLEQTLTGDKDTDKVYAYELVATDRCGTVSLTNEPCVVTVTGSSYALSVEQKKVSFDKLVEGYTASSIAWVTDTLTNDSDNLTGLTITGNTYFDLSGYTKGMSVAKGDQVDLKIRPKADLKADGTKEKTYTDTLTVTTDQGTVNTINVTVTVVPLDASLEIDSKSITFDPRTEGYTIAEADYQEVVITYKDKGNVSGAASTINISAPAFSSFTAQYSTDDEATWSDFRSDQSLNLGKSMYVKISPKIGLKASGVSSKTYTESTVFSESLGSFSASFTVNAKPIVEISASAVENNKITLTATVTGGTPDYRYTWTNKSGKVIKESLEANEISVAADEAETYTCTVLDSLSNSCFAYHSVDTYDLDVKVDSDKSDSYDFGTVIEGYAVAPDAVGLTLKNNSTSVIRNITTRSQDDYVISGLSDIGSLAAGQSADITVRPKTGLKAGDHTVKLVFDSDLCTSADVITLSFTVKAKDQTLKVEPKELKFSDTTEGYTKTADAQTVTVTNIGNSKVKITVPTPKNFKISGWNTDKTLEAGKSFSFKVGVGEGLSAGDKTEEITLKTDADNQDNPQTIKAVLNVNSAPKAKINGTMSVVSGGTATLGCEVTGGTSPYTYSWSTGGSDESATFTPTADTNVKLTVTDAAGVTTTAEATVTVTKAAEVKAEHDTTSSVVFPAKSTAETVHSLTASVGLMDFGSMVTGSDSHPEGQKVTITNTGTVDETIAKPVSDYFTVSDMNGNVELEAGESMTVTITPKVSLAIGSYTEHIDFTGAGKAMAGLVCTYKVVDTDGTLPLTENRTFTDLNYKYGTGKLNFDVVSDTETPVIGVDDTASTAGAILNDSGMQMLADGSVCNIRLTTKTIDDTISETEKSIIEDALVQYQTQAPGIKVGMYMDLTLEKQIDNSDWIEVTETDEPVNLVLDVPDELKSLGAEYYLFREHNGVVTPITSWEAGQSMVSFETTKCSTYAICYVPNSSANSLSPLLGTGTHSITDLYRFITFTGIALVGFTVLIILMIKFFRRIKEESADRD